MKFDLVFEGGGSKGAAFIGALEEFEARGHTTSRLVGTSAGAIMAALLAAGQHASGMRRAILERRPDGTPVFAGFLDVVTSFTEQEKRSSLMAELLDRIDLPLIPDQLEERIDRALLDGLLGFPIFRQFISLVERGGVYEGKVFHEWIVARLDEIKPGLGSATFEEFSARTGSDLSVIVSDTDGQQMLALNHRTAPRCPVSWAVRMSASIPFVWQEVEWRPAWGPYMGHDITGHRMVDGGLLSNFPIHLLTSTLSEVVQIMGDDDPAAIPNIGFLIDEDLEVEGLTIARERPAGLHDRPMKRLYRLVDTMLNAHDQVVISSCLQNDEICRLPARGFGAVDFYVTETNIDALIRAGRRATGAYFDRREQAIAARNAGIAKMET